MLRYLLVISSCCLTVGLLTADESPGANKSTATIKLFDGSSTFGWESSGSVAVKGSAIVLGDTKPGTIKSFTRFPVGKVIIIAQADPGQKLTVSVAENSQTMTQSTKTTKTIAITAPSKISISGHGRILEIYYQPGKMTSLFNGKDLTGWGIFDGRENLRSKFAVTTNGELSVKDGPGDIFTKSKHQNFFLQLDCKTLGEALNSGIFFRCIADQYQQGYEAQIQNGMKDNDPTQPTDYGTGAIYRRIKARKIVAKDQEWFTLTVLADGNRFSTWVNGYQVVAWEDTREPDENARRGFCENPGHLSIQGHDPTTDLLFRNLNIIDFK